MRILAAFLLASGCNLVSGLDDFAVHSGTGSGGQAGSATSASAGGSEPTPCVTGVAAHRHQTCVALRDGSAWCFGDNTYGQLGDGTGMSSAVPVRVPNLPAVREIAVGGTSAYALGEDGNVYAWGGNTAGQLGVGHTSPQPTPALVANLTNVVRIAAGSAHACAIDAADTLYCWGSNQFGQIATPTTPVPIAILPGVRGVACGTMHTCGLDANGRVFCFGTNDSGQLGSPSHPGTPAPVDGMLLAVEVAASGRVSCARSTAGRVFCWGANTFGQVGDTAAGAGVFAPSEVPGVLDAAAIAVSGRRACAITASRQLWCWGELGIATPMSPAAVMVMPPNHVVALDGADRIGLATYHACLRLPEGLVCTGQGSSGELGHGVPQATGRFVRPLLPCDSP